MAIEPIRKDTTCRVCGSTNITTVFKLMPTPPGDVFVTKEELDIPQEVYPLDLALCDGCGYLHLPYVLNPEISYREYIYVSKVTLGLGDHYKEYADQVIAITEPEQSSLVIDLGSNDGTMLEAFKRRNMNVLGVEPSRRIATAATVAGIPTIADFFSDQVADTIVSEYGRAAIVTANYMFANIDDVVGFTKNVTKILDQNGVFVVQTGYHPEQMKIGMFDYIYHEHFSYFTVTVLQELFDHCGLELISAEKNPAKGGSIRVIGQLKGAKRPVSPSVAEIVIEEENEGMRDSSTYINFAKDINQRKAEVLEVLRELKDKGERIVGYGASHSTTTLTYHFGLAPFMEYIVDDNVLKHGLYSPGHHLAVYPSNKLLEDKPSIVVVLAWQYQDPIINKNYQFIEEGGKFIIPLPTLKVV